MDIKHLQKALRRAGGALAAAKARPQAQAVQAVVSLIDAAPDQSVEEFVENTAALLKVPDLTALSAAELSARLREAGADKASFESIFKALSDRTFDKVKIIQVASQFTGASGTAWSSKPQALKAIKSKFEERVFLEAKARHNVRVTPW